MELGERIKQIRLENGLTQKQLGEMLGSTQQMIAQYESGKHSPKIETVRKIANALGTNIFHLTDGDYSNFSVEELRNDFLSVATPLDEFHKQLVAKAQKEENELLGNYRSLNSSGQTEARKRVQELTEIKRYTEPDEPPAE